MLNNLGEHKTTKKILQEITQSVCVSGNVDSSVMQSSVSIGMVIYPEDGTEKNTLMHHADMAMHEMKNREANQASGDHKQ